MMRQCWCGFLLSMCVPCPGLLPGTWNWSPPPTSGRSCWHLHCCCSCCWALPCSFLCWLRANGMEVHLLGYTFWQTFDLATISCCPDWNLCWMYYLIWLHPLVLNGRTPLLTFCRCCGATRVLKSFCALACKANKPTTLQSLRTESPRAHLLVVDIFGLCHKNKLTKLAHYFLFCSRICLCLLGPFNAISFHKFSRQLFAFSLCSSGLNSALLVLSTIYLFMKVSLSPDVILCGWLGFKHQLTD